MEKMADAQLMSAGKDPEAIRKALAGDDYEEPKKLSKSEIKQEQRKKINEARKKAAEEMGDEDADLTQDEKDKLSAARARMAAKYGD